MGLKSNEIETSSVRRTTSSTTYGASPDGGGTGDWSQRLNYNLLSLHSSEFNLLFKLETNAQPLPVKYALRVHKKKE